MASHPVGHSADAPSSEPGRYFSNRSRWPFEQAGFCDRSKRETFDVFALCGLTSNVVIPNPAAFLAHGGEGPACGLTCLTATPK